MKKRVLNEETTLDDIPDNIPEELLSPLQQHKLVIKRMRLHGAPCMTAEEFAQSLFDDGFIDDVSIFDDVASLLEILKGPITPFISDIEDAMASTSISTELVDQERPKEQSD